MARKLQLSGGVDAALSCILFLLYLFFHNLRLRAKNERLRVEIAVVKKEIALSAVYTPDMASRSLPEQPVSFLTCFAGNHLSAS